MRAVDIIIKKRDGGVLSDGEIAFFIEHYLRDEIPDYQTSALLMAIFFQGMTFEETAELTRQMIHSGEVFDLSSLAYGFPVDKHSTGGVGDKISLPLAPLAAACGLAVPMVSGRGLGHTGGTLDKLESIPGFNVNLTREQFLAQLERIGVVMAGQTETFVPADKRLYALRDVTGTVESIPLICASIMSKKIASGARAFVMDVKTGTGAFMPTIERSRALAEGLIGVGKAMDRPVHALITDMNQPLGRWIGNSLEVIESLSCLKGDGPPDVRELTLRLTAEMLVLGKVSPSREEAYNYAKNVLDSGKALEKFQQLIEAQGGDPRVVENAGLLNVAPDETFFAAPSSGYLASVNCRELGNAAVVLGGGRNKTTDAIDHGVGLEMRAKIGNPVKQGEPIVRIVHRKGRGLDECVARLSKAFHFSEEPVEPPPLVYETLE
ncbi:MAG: thymidine phosphorylase [Candidatus Sumerlaeaceae bacterium]|nr:thymidine phosphorylase [Candidatus Sumerlaeaceae bacterium]